MKTLLLLLIPLLASCTVITHPTAGTYASLGGDASGLVATESGWSAGVVNNSEAIRQARGAFATWVITRGLVDAWDTAAGVTNTSTAADVSKAKIDADKAISIKKIENPLPVAEAIPGL